MVAVALAATTAGCGLGPGDSSPGDGDAHRDPRLRRRAGARGVRVRPDGVRHRDAGPRTRGRDHHPLRRRLRAVDRRPRGQRQRDGRSHRLVLLRQRGRVARAARADVAVRGGDRIWWDYRDWTAAMRVARPWSAPGRSPSCRPRRTSPSRLAVDASAASRRRRLRPRLGSARRRRRRRPGRSPATVGDAAIRVLVGPWATLRSDPAAARSSRRPGQERRLRRFEPTGPAAASLQVLDATGADGPDARGRAPGSSPPRAATTGR